jgi:nucleoside phosphorylase
MGRVQAGVATSDAIRRWRPHYVLLVGIAGGVEAKGVRLGDVLISDQIVDYELQKLTAKGVQVRWQVHRAAPRLLSAVLNFSDTGWYRQVTTWRPDPDAPKRHVGPIASGDKVIAFDKVLAKYRDTWPALIGVEMEAAGAATAAFQAAEQPGFFMIRGVSDFADQQKGTPDVDRWRAYACDVAAAYTIGLLRSGPVPLSAAQAS